jgi:hypothetical protein
LCSNYFAGIKTQARRIYLQLLNLLKKEWGSQLQGFVEPWLRRTLVPHKTNEHFSGTLL